MIELTPSNINWTDLNPSAEGYRRGHDQIDVDAIVFTLTGWAEEVFDETQGAIYELARKYVPVRQIFRRGPRGASVPRLKLPGNAANAQVLKAMRAQKFTKASQFVQFKASLERKRTIDIARRDYEAVRKLEDIDQFPKYQGEGKGYGRRSGSPNDLYPVTSRGGIRVYGDLRRVSHGGKGATFLESGPVIVKSGGQVRLYSLAALNKTKPRPVSTARYDLRNGRGLVRRPSTRAELANHLPPQFQYGGRLRNSIKKEEESGDGRHTWRVTAGGDEVYPNEQTTVGEVARYMEFGTSHNRAYPFLRPAFYESGALKLRQKVADRIQSGGQ